MVVVGGSNKGIGVDTPNLNVMELLRWLNLTEDEEVIVDFIDDEEEEESLIVE